MELKNFIASGDIYDVYESDGMAVRVYKDAKYKEKCLYAALTHARVETALTNTELKIPVLREVSLIDGKWAISMEWIEGKTLGMLIDENPEMTDLYVDRLVDIQCEIHKQYMPLLSKLKDKLWRQIEALSTIGEIDAIKKYELQTRLESMPKHQKLCHNNFDPDCVIINEEGTYVLNWGSARQGNASADAAKTFLLLSLKRPELAESYLDKYCQKTGTSKHYVQRWLPIVAAAQLDKGIPEQKDLLMRWLDVFDWQ